MPALNEGANRGVGQPSTWKLLDGSAENGAEGVLLHGVSREVVVAVPHTDGFASGAPGPPSRRSVSFSKGCWGLSSKTVVSCPVCWSTCVRPASLIRTYAPSSYWACRNRRTILPSAASL